MRNSLYGLLLTIGCATQTAWAQASSDEWHFTVMPYLWLPTIDGELAYSPPAGGGGAPQIKVGPTDWLELLNFAALISGSARKGRFVVMSDLVYLSLQAKDGRVLGVENTPVDVMLNLNTKTDFDGLAWTLAGGYNIADTDTASMDVFAGIRYFGTDAKTSWNMTTDLSTPNGEPLLSAAGSIGKSTDLWDGIIGIRGTLKLSAEKWSIPYYADVGSGSSEVTWQAMTGLSYAFNWGDVLLVYRHLEYDQGANSLLQNFSFSGPAFGAKFSF